MGRLPDSAFEVRLATTLFLLLLGLADAFGAWQVKDFASFTPRGVAAAVHADVRRAPAPAAASSTVSETPVDLAALDVAPHRIDRALLVQDTHVHVPVYAMTAAFLALIVFGLSLSRPARVTIILLAFASPFVDFVGLWGAHLFPAAGTAFGALAIAGGAGMGVAYLVVLLLVFRQCWFPCKERRLHHA